MFIMIVSKRHDVYEERYSTVHQPLLSSPSHFSEGKGGSVWRHATEAGISGSLIGYLTRMPT